MNREGVLWILGPKEYINSGIAKYSLPFIDKLKDEGFYVKEKWINYKARSIKRYIYQFVVLPVYLFFLSKKYGAVVIYEESLSFLCPFIRARKILIIHDARKISGNNKVAIVEVFKAAFNKLQHYYYNRYDHVVSVSEHTKVELEKQGLVEPNTVNVIYNSFDMPKIFSIEKKLDKRLFEKIVDSGQYSNKIKLLYVGSEESRKNFVTLLYVLEQLGEKYVLIKVGKPIIEKNRVKHAKIIEQKHLPVVFLESISESDLIDLYYYSDIFLFPSTYEGFGRPPIEAQSCGLPVVSTDCGALKEVLRESAVIVKSPFSIDEWTSSIYKLQNDKLRNSFINKGIENADRFTLDCQITLWIRLLKL